MSKRGVNLEKKCTHQLVIVETQNGHTILYKLSRQNDQGTDTWFIDDKIDFNSKTYGLYLVFEQLEARGSDTTSDPEIGQEYRPRDDNHQEIQLIGMKGYVNRRWKKIQEGAEKIHKQIIFCIARKQGFNCRDAVRLSMAHAGLVALFPKAVPYEETVRHGSYKYRTPVTLLSYDVP